MAEALLLPPSAGEGQDGGEIRGLPQSGVGEGVSPNEETTFEDR